MDPNSGRIYPTRLDAIADGVTNPVEVHGRPEDVQRISRAVAHYSAVTGADKTKRRAANKAARKARRAGRR